MFDVGFQEILVIGVIALLVFGPGKLPELGRMFGRVMREFRRASDEFRSTVETNLHINDFDPVVTDQPPTPAAVAEAVPAADPTSAGPAAFPSESDAGATLPDAGTDNPEPFCAQRGSKIFHRKECTWVRRIPDVERVYLKEFADARDQGLLACPVCDPSEAT